MRLQRWLSENQVPELAGVSWPSIDPESQFSIPITEKFSFDPNSDLSAGQRPVFGCFEALFGLPELDFHSASVGGTTFEGSLKTFLKDLDGMGE